MEEKDTRGRYVFVTVGTTKFEALVEQVDSEAFGAWLQTQGADLRVVVQRGAGAYEPRSPWIAECYTYKPSLAADMGGAALVITHAGSGSVLEALRLRRRTCVVANTALMDNHQTELAQELHRRGLVAYAAGAENLLTALTDVHIGFEDTEEGAAEKTAATATGALVPANSFTEFLSYDVLGGKRWGRGSLMVLGSGGHTTEMLWMLGSLPAAASGTTVGLDSLAPRRYAVAETDKMSGPRAEAFDADARVVSVPRSREVGQSYLSSVWTTLVALVCAFVALWRDTPSLVICNGPGTCVPVLVAVWLVRLLKWTEIETVYIESVARVQHLSLSGRIVRRLNLADRFVVQWPTLAKQCGAAVLLRNFFFPI